MSAGSKIAWTDATWNPIVGCSKVSPGCANCYAEKMAARLAAMGQDKYQRVTAGRQWNDKTYMDPVCVAQLGRWKKSRNIFVCSMGDLFHESLSNERISSIFALMYLSPHHRFQVLTKRADRMRDWVRWEEISHGPLLSNVWLGVTAEDQQRANERIPHLLAAPAAVRFVSVEPMLSAVDLSTFTDARRIHLYPGTGGSFVPPHVSWVIIGCESGPRRRPCRLEWVQALVRECRANRCPCFVKQLELDGRVSRDPAEWPQWARVREMPR